MPPRISWRDLLPGLIASAVIALVAIGVLVFAGVGAVRGEKIRLYVLADQARGIMHGSDVWLAGQKIGAVDAVGFTLPSNDSLGRVVIAVDVRKSDAGQIRRDSRVQIRAGGNIIGPIVVYVDAGTPESPAVRDGDTLRASAVADVVSAGAKMTDATKQLGPLMADARAVMAQVRDPDGTVGAALRERGGGQVARLRSSVARLRQRMGNGNGHTTAGPAGAMVQARSALARADSIRTLLRSSNSSYGRFRRDTTLKATVASVRDELAGLQAKLDSADGTMARMVNDSAMTRSIASAKREMALLFEDIRKRPMRYVHF
jgi:phospholipid/cholesterol/gamma-HCH transport system substrate-binding protein